MEKFVDALVWAFFPIYFIAHGLSVVQIGWIVGVYGLVWGVSQLWTGPLSDAIGRKWPIVIGMWVCAAGVTTTVLLEGVAYWVISAAVNSGAKRWGSKSAAWTRSLKRETVRNSCSAEAPSTTLHPQTQITLEFDGGTLPRTLIGKP